MVKNSCRAQRTVSVNVTLWSKQPNLLKLFPTESAQTRAVREYNVNDSQIDKKMPILEVKQVIRICKYLIIKKQTIREQS